MQIVILASGKGKRMGDLTKNVPKPMLKIKGKPILEHKLNALPREIKEIIFVIGYRGEQIMDYFKKCWNGMKITYVVQKNLNGTGAAVHLVKSFVGERFLVMMGDDLYHKKDIKKMLQHNLAILGHEVEDTSLFGIIKADNRKNMTDVIEKPKKSKERLANTGLYMINRKFFDYELVQIASGEYGLPQTLAHMTKEHKIKVEKATDWFPIGNANDLKKAEEIIHKFR
jgi:UDP-N-acetylglucosamine diphosphorylase / glucose-1-phosphate thymidylyltransferase / UDP-N-acetylgalactosamine diphosphorylase / glucosamine-1-phosphate N-acetyltransferase / galactosamine-1-phosphate N-acetyltransferase